MTMSRRVERANSTSALELAEAGIAGDDPVDAVVAAVVEHAHDAHVAVDVDLELADELLGDGAAAVDGRAAIKAALARPVTHERGDGKTLGDERGGAGGVPQGKPYAGELVAHLQEEDAGDEQSEGGGPAQEQPRHLPEGRGEGGKRVKAQKLESAHRGEAHRGDGDQERHVGLRRSARRRKGARSPAPAATTVPKSSSANRAADHNERDEARLVVEAEIGKTRDLARHGERPKAAMRALCDGSANIQHS